MVLGLVLTGDQVDFGDTLDFARRAEEANFDSLWVTELWRDAFVPLTAIAMRISEFGFTPNRVAALGENLVLLVNLTWSAWLYVRFLRGRGAFGALERWQMAYLPVYSVWAAFVVTVFPPVFGFR